MNYANMKFAQRSWTRTAAITTSAILVTAVVASTAESSTESNLRSTAPTEYTGTFSPFPGVATEGRGTVTASLNRETGQVTVRAEVSALTSRIVRTGIRTPGAGSMDLVATPGTDGRSGAIEQTVNPSDAIISALINGRMVIRVNTASNPRAEVDATLLVLPLTAPPSLTTAPPTTTAATTAPATTAPATTAPATTVSPTTVHDHSTHNHDTTPATTVGPAPTPIPTTTPAQTPIPTTTPAPAPGTQAPPAGAQVGRSFGVWNPSRHDSCSAAIHDNYWTFGPDGKVYPTWHPAVDLASGCTFGHEHGADPVLSKVKNPSLPFGYVNEQLSESDAGFHRDEDHVGHKVEIANDVPMSLDQFGPPVNRCNFLFKLHMGTHSADAFGQNLHEVFNYISCDNGLELRMQTLNPFGKPGQFTAGCDLTTVVQAGSSQGVVDSGSRDIPTRQCIDTALVPEGRNSQWAGGGGAGLERWVVFYSRDNAAPGFGRVFSQIYLNVENSSRYFDPAAPNNLARQVDLCYLTGDRQVRRDGYCDKMKAAFPDQRIAFDDPRSPFNGGKRFLTTAQVVVQNKSGSTDWYTDVFGNNYSRTPFKGAVKQYISLSDTDQTTKYGFTEYPADHSKEPGIHAPN